jgi:hypothetical protein
MFQCHQRADTILVLVCGAKWTEMAYEENLW